MLTIQVFLNEFLSPKEVIKGYVVAILSVVAVILPLLFLLSFYTPFISPVRTPPQISFPASRTVILETTWYFGASVET